MYKKLNNQMQNGKQLYVNVITGTEGTLDELNYSRFVNGKDDKGMYHHSTRRERREFRQETIRGHAKITPMNHKNTGKRVRQHIVGKRVIEWVKDKYKWVRYKGNTLLHFTPAALYRAELMMRNTLK